MPKRKGAQERHSRPAACVGCGEAAVGYNYDAPSCFSCKTFFRRTALANPHGLPECLKGGICARDVRKCRACRFENCVKGGMKASHILLNNNEPDGEENGKYYSEKPSTSNWTGHSKPEERVNNARSGCSDVEMRIVANPFRFECNVEKTIQNLLSIEAAHQMLRISSYTPKIDGNVTLDQFVSCPSKLGENFLGMHTAPYEAFPTPHYPLEVIVKKGIRMNFSGNDYSKKKLWFIHDVIYSIEFIKALPIFHLLEPKSKKVFIASALTCSNFTAAYYSYSHRSDRTLYPNGATLSWKSEIEEQAPGTTRLHTGIIAAIKEADLNSHEYILLKIIVVCNPMLNGLDPQDAVLLHHEREHCTKSLLSYVLARRGVKEGPAFFMRILSIVDVLTRLTSWEKGLHILARAMGLYSGKSAFSEAIVHSH